MIHKQKVHIIVSGRVQGVFFRDFTCRRAQSLGLCGWVKNTRDGNVEIVAEGDREKINKFIELVKIGPPSSEVTDCKIEWGEFRGELREFEIIY